MPLTSLTSLTVADHVATLTIEPPDGLADAAFDAALADAAAEVAADTDGVRALIVTGTVPAFCAGWSAEALAASEPPVAAGIHALAAVPQPVIAAIEGSAHSAGLEIALACDIRVAGAGATFAMPETGNGAVPSGGGTQRLPRVVGRAHALRMLLTGDELDAAEAKRIGLLSRVVATGEAASLAAELAAAIASRGPIATRMAKEAVHRGAEMALEQALRYELDLTVMLQTTADRAEGVRAFAAKRPPNFTGH
ncbi:MAG TPA: enoyl-CoA hydratase/isomerase family protein [Dehalococcoidia bacterium]|nr:enoyl-CoA hydratase/isomerase family protein [Dehalococcoidia bacterium]